MFESENADLVIASDQLSKGIGRITPALSKRSITEAMTGIYLRASDNHSLQLRASWVSSDVITTRPAEVRKPFTTVVAATFSDWAASVNGQVFIRLQGNKLQAQCGSREATFGTYNHKEYPNEKARPEIDALETVNALDFITAINQVSFAMATSSEKPAYQGIRITPLATVAADGHRSAFWRGLSLERFDFLLSSEAVATLQDLLSNSDDIQIAEANGWAYARNDVTECWLATRNSKFPVKAFVTPMAVANIPAQRIVVDKEQILGSLGYARTLGQIAHAINDRETVDIVVDEDGKVFVRMALKNGQGMNDELTTAYIKDANGDRLRVDGKFNGETVAGRVYPGMCSQAIKRASGDTVELTYITSKNPMEGPDGRALPPLPHPVWFISCPEVDGWGVMQSPTFTSPTAGQVEDARKALRERVDVEGDD